MINTSIASAARTATTVILAGAAALGFATSVAIGTAQAAPPRTPSGATTYIAQGRGEVVPIELFINSWASNDDQITFST